MDHQENGNWNNSLFFDRSNFKRRAKDALSRNGYWLAFLVCILAGVLGGGPSLSFNYSQRISVEETETVYRSIESVPAYFWTLFFSMFTGAMLIAIAWSVFVSNPVTVGMARYFLRHSGERAEVGTLFSPFTRKYMNVVKTVFLKNLYVGLWWLLFIIPGIIKMYQYRLVEYIMAENPELSTDRALKLSKAMTDGQKFEIFILELSFIGWYLLGALAFGIGILFVTPYVEATFAEMYLTFRERALDLGMATQDELPGFAFIEQN